MADKYNVYINIEHENTDTGDCLPAGNGEVTLVSFDDEYSAECLMDRIIAFSNSNVSGNVHENPVITSVSEGENDD
jgi:hypothetical protein